MIVLLTIIASSAYLWLAAHDKIDTSWWPLYCGFKQKYDLPCPGCGMTTAALIFARGRIFQAFYIQPAAAFFCCLLIFSAILAFIAAAFGVTFRFVDRFFTEVKVRYIVLAVIVIIAAGWAVTLARALANDY